MEQTRSERACCIECGEIPQLCKVIEVGEETVLYLCDACCETLRLLLGRLLDG